MSERVKSHKIFQIIDSQM